MQMDKNDNNGPNPDTVRELTPRAVILGLVLAVVMGAANAYLGLFAGMTVSASIPASVVAMAILAVLGRADIQEANIVQTGASAGESLAAGAIFTLPALIILGFWKDFHYLWVFVIAALGGILGVLFTVPLRRSLIIEQGLTFPEGVATAQVLKVGENPKRGARALASAALAGGLAKFAATGLHLWHGTATAAAYVGKSIAYVSAGLSPALLGVGYIVRFNIAVLVFLGGAIAWYVAMPIYVALHPAAGTTAAHYAQAVWSGQIRYMGVGAMVVGGIWSLLAIRSSIFSGIASGLRQYGEAFSIRHVERADRDLPMRAVLIAAGVCIVPLFIVYQLVTHTVHVAIPITIIMGVAAFVFSAVAGYMTGLVGSSNNPVSGVTIATVLLAALVLLALMGRGSGTGAAATILVGGVVACAAAIAGDNLHDLKAGYLIGTTPWKQQVILILGVVTAALVMAPILDLLNAAYHIGSAQLPAPQAVLMASVARGVFHGGLPWTMIAVGAGIGVAIIILDQWLGHRGSTFRMPVLAVAIGIYLPLELSTPILAGGIVAWLVERSSGRAGDLAGIMSSPGVLFAAGLITGESLLGIILAVPIVISHNPNVFAVPAALRPGDWLGVLVMLVLAAWLYAVGRRNHASA